MKATIDGALRSSTTCAARGRPAPPPRVPARASSCGTRRCEALAATHRVVRFDARGFGGQRPRRGPAHHGAHRGRRGGAPRSRSGSRRRWWAAARWAATPPSPSSRRHPQRLSGLVLQDTRAGADTPEAKASRATLARRVLAEGASAAAEAFLPKLARRDDATASGRRSSRALRERILATSPRGIANALHGLAARADSRATLPTIRGADPGAGGRGGRADTARARPRSWRPPSRAPAST